MQNQLYIPLEDVLKEVVGQPPQSVTVVREGRWLCHCLEEVVRKEAEERDLCIEGFCRARQSNCT